MQGLTLSFGQAGIEAFVNQAIKSQLITELAGFTPKNSQIEVGSFEYDGSDTKDDYSGVVIRLTDGSLSGFNMTYTGITQLASGSPAGSQFLLSFATSNQFTVNYNWEETGTKRPAAYVDGRWIWGPKEGFDHSFSYGPAFASLGIQLTVSFQYDSTHNRYNIVNAGVNATPSGESANIPTHSVLQSEGSCFNTHVSDQVAQAVSTIDFGGGISKLIPPMIDSIAASGDLGNGIVFDFGLGDDGMQFSCASGQNGLRIGATGLASFKGTPYPVAPPAKLDLPPFLDSSNSSHVQAYVSGWSVNALNWGFYSANLLNVSVGPGNIQPPNVLWVKTYTTYVQALVKWDNDVMRADVTPKAAPTVSFQAAWNFDKSAMAKIQANLPSDVNTKLQDSTIIGNAYLSTSDLEEALTSISIDAQYFAQIESYTKVMGMICNHDLDYTLTIQTQDGSPKPYIKFSVQRSDLLSNLRLGIAPQSGAQTMQFDFVKLSSTATFESSSIPNFPTGINFGALVWGLAGEPQYELLASTMGKIGVPIPIMQGFQFVFEQAQLNVADGYVSILAQVELKS